MRDCIDCGPAPPMENCAQVGSPDYGEQARKECRAYVALLRRMLGPEPDGASLRITSNPHDFGTYLSVACYFDPAIEAAVDYALRCEAAGPQEWDDVARKELSLDTYTPTESQEDSERR